jgi:eukaryotic-like serine/threonine-protein kinase
LKLDATITNDSENTTSMQGLEIDPQLWSELNQLLDVALELPVAQRGEWLASLDERHASLKPHLDAFLQRAARIETRDFLQTLPKVGIEAPRSSEQAGASVGPYRLTSELGSGGMGSVWLAERTDGLLKRPVALKLPHVVSRRAGLAERMAREREILGALTHPNIARLYDAGLTSEGRPYLAIEYVAGLRIDKYCQEQALAVETRLRLFLQVTNAVAYAHAQLIIHRDLKPANILVTRDGEVKLLDFGVAKLLDEGLARSTQLTELSGRALTLDYASPEQVAGEPLTTAADVYSLGVVLFELLTDERPYRVKRDSRGALEEAILESALRQPSDAAVPSRRAALVGDLDAILMKALSRQTAERYPTVSALADDLTRHLEQRPVLARPASAWSNLRKFSMRHRLAVSLSTVAALAVLVGSGIAVWQMLEAREQRDLAVSQQQRALASSEFLTMLFEEIGASDEALKPAELLDRGAAMLDAQYASEARLNAHMLYEVASRYGVIGQIDREVALFDRVVANARAIGDAELAASALCMLSLSRVVTDAPQARSEFAKAQAELERVSQPSASTQVACLRARSRILQADGNLNGAIASLEEALRVLDAAPAATATTRIAVLTEMGEYFSVTDRATDALRVIDQAIALYDATGRQGSMSKVINLVNRASILSRMGEIVAAEADQREALRLGRRFGDENLLAQFESHLANSLVRLHRCEEALPLLEKARAAAAESGNVRSEAASNLLLGSCALRLGRLDQVGVPLARAEAIWGKNEAANRRLLNEIALTRAELKTRSGQTAAAVSDVEAIMTAVGYPNAPRPPGISSILYRSALAHLANGSLERARQLAAASAVAASRIARDPARSADVGQALLIEATALTQLGKRDQARSAVDAAQVSLESGFGAEHPNTREAKALSKRLTTDF